jgi:hypothetical protein
MNRALSYKLVDDLLYKKIERRKSRRVQVNCHAFALARPMGSLPLRIMNKSMGEIACTLYRSKPIMLGKINNISMEGLSFCYIDCKKPTNRPLVLDILMADHGLYIENLTFKSIFDFELKDDIIADLIKIRQIHIEFNRLLPYQLFKLERFISEISEVHKSIEEN